MSNDSIKLKAIVCENVSKSFASGEKFVSAVENISLKVEDGEFVCIIGPSGCGKSTLLNMVAGFDTPTSGEISLNGKIVTGPGPERGMVFQDYGLFPWLNVRDNIEFGLKESGMKKSARQDRGQLWIEMIGLKDFSKSFPSTLSGGMRQRVGMARALAMDPAVLLLDEPFSALDYLTRLLWQREMENIWLKTKKTILFVTHSVEEAVMLGDRIVTMTSRPSKIKEIFAVNLARPRDPTNMEFNDLKRRVLESVISEVKI